MILDLEKQSVKVEAGGDVLCHKSFVEEVGVDNGGSSQNKIYWNPKGQHFLVIEHVRMAIGREFGVADSGPVVEFNQFSIKQKQSVTQQSVIYPCTKERKAWLTRSANVRV